MAGSSQQTRSDRKAEPDSFFLLDYLALTSACLGVRMPRAPMLTERRNWSRSRRRAQRPAELEIYARTAALTGDTEQAITALQKLLSIPTKVV